MSRSNVLFSVRLRFHPEVTDRQSTPRFRWNLSEGVSSPFPDPSCANTAPLLRREYRRSTGNQTPGNFIRASALTWRNRIRSFPGDYKLFIRRTSWLLLKSMMENGTFQINEPNIFHILKGILQHPARVLFLSWGSKAVIFYSDFKRFVSFFPPLSSNFFLFLIKG